LIPLGMHTLYGCFPVLVLRTELFWGLSAVEPILTLRALTVSQGGRCERYWNSRPDYPRAAWTVADPGQEAREISTAID